MKTRLLKNDTGFSLLEVMIALTIFAVGVLAAAKLQYRSVLFNVDVNQMTEAALLAQAKVEEIVTFDFATLEDNDSDGAAGLDDAEVATADGNDPAHFYEPYQVFWNIRDVPQVNPDHKQVRVIVAWQDKGIQRRYRIDTILIPRI